MRLASSQTTRRPQEAALHALHKHPTQVDTSLNRDARHFHLPHATSIHCKSPNSSSKCLGCTLSLPAFSLPWSLPCRWASTALTRERPCPRSQARLLFIKFKLQRLGTNSLRATESSFAAAALFPIVKSGAVSIIIALTFLVDAKRAARRMGFCVLQGLASGRLDAR